MSKRLQKKEELNFQSQVGAKVENNTKDIVTISNAVDAINEKTTNDIQVLASSVENVSKQVEDLTKNVDKISKTDFLTKKDLAGIKKAVTPKKGIDYDDGIDGFDFDSDLVKKELNEKLDKKLSEIEKKLEPKEINAKDIKGIKDLLPKHPPMYGGGSGATFLKSLRDVDISGLTKNAQGKYELGSGDGGGNTLYSADDTLSGNRTVSLGGNSLTIEGETGSNVEVIIGANGNAFGEGVKGWATAAIDGNTDDTALSGVADWSAFGLNDADSVSSVIAYAPDAVGVYYAVAKNGGVEIQATDGLSATAAITQDESFSVTSSNGSTSSSMSITPSVINYQGIMEVRGKGDTSSDIVANFKNDSLAPILRVYGDGTVEIGDITSDTEYRLPKVKNANPRAVNITNDSDGTMEQRLLVEADISDFGTYLEPGNNLSELTTDALTSLLNTNGYYIQFDDDSGFVDSTEFPFIFFTKDTSPVNNFRIRNADTGSAPVLEAMGSDTDIGIDYVAKGAGTHNFNTDIIADKRIQGKKGSDVASATDITLGDGNYFDITGTTQIDTIVATDWQAGSIVTLQFDASVTVKHATSGTGAELQLAGSTDFSATAGDTLMLVYDGTYWREVSRTVI